MSERPGITEPTPRETARAELNAARIAMWRWSQTSLADSGDAAVAQAAALTSIAASLHRIADALAPEPTTPEPTEPPTREQRA